MGRMTCFLGQILLKTFLTYVTFRAFITVLGQSHGVLGNQHFHNEKNEIDLPILLTTPQAHFFHLKEIFFTVVAHSILARKEKPIKG
jgi:hypothetical protein